MIKKAMVTKETNNEHTFHMGICMAGAISAGAYTAGVVDYLLEALEHWEFAKMLQRDNALTGIPKHNISIEVLGGASAGGMTAAVTAGAVQSAFQPITQARENDTTYTLQNPLFDSWVNLTETEKEDMLSRMLSTADIENNEENIGKEVRAGLNSAFIRQIADKLENTKVEVPHDRKYIANDLDVFTTITNLRGFLYKVTFNTSSGPREHLMKMHRDYAFFKITNDETGKDGRIPVNFSNGLNTEILAQAAMSTGAFPIGLESRELKRKIDYINQNKYLNLHLQRSLYNVDGQKAEDKSNSNASVLKFKEQANGRSDNDADVDSGTSNPKEAGSKEQDSHRSKIVNLVDDTTSKDKVIYEIIADADFLTLNVDGGLINNEPFEITQQLLDDRRRTSILGDNPTKEQIRLANQYTASTSASEFDSLVLMIDPFPSDDLGDKTDYVPKKAWRNIVPAILSAMRGQLMMKDEQLRKAYLSEDYTRFLIMPSRTLAGKTQKYNLACASLEGFGGFFSKSFRKHDFFLGRRNCQKFLQNHFSVPESAKNPSLEFGYDSIEKYKFVENGKTYLPLIPDLRIVQGPGLNDFKVNAPEEEKEYPYPKLSLKYIVGLEKKVEVRIECILKNIANQITNENRVENSKILERLRKKSTLQNIGEFVGGIVGSMYLYLGRWKGKSLAARACIDAVIRDMEKRDLIEDDLI